MAPRPIVFYAGAALAVLAFLTVLSSYTALPEGWPTRVQRPLNTSAEFSTFHIDPSDSLAYRNHLEQTTSPPAQITHSPTMTFDHIYVLSLPHRLDRRAEMTKLADALGFRITFVDAFLKDEPFIKWIGEQAAAVRKERVQIIADALDISPSKIGGLHIGNDWLIQTVKDASGKVTAFADLEAPHAFAEGSWVDHLEAYADAGRLHELVPSDPDFNVTAALWDRNEKIAGRQVNEGVISTFFGHVRAMKTAIKNGDASALILEDDVDMEWDIERLWSRMQQRLPRSWEVAFLGHCWGRELLKPAFLHPLLHRSSQPLCLHGYALTKKGARHVVQLLNSPWTAYQTAVDTAIPSFVRFQLLNSFSVEPPIIIQRKDVSSDIQTGVGSIWRGYLMDSTVDRILIDEGGSPEQRIFFDDEKKADPATVFRYGKSCAPNSREGTQN